MTIDIKTGAIRHYECPECRQATRGLINGHCAKCEQVKAKEPSYDANYLHGCYQHLNFGPRLA